MMLRFLYYFLISYLIYRFVFNFLIPVISTTFRFKKQVDQVKRNMQDHMEREYARQSNNGSAKQENAAVNTDNIGGEYIDFEEVK